MNNRFQYTNSFSKIMEFSVYHDYYEDNKLVAAQLIPSQETKELIRNYNLLLRKKGNSFFLLKNNNSNLDSQVFNGEVVLNFKLLFNDPLFLNITDIPFGYQQKFIFNSANSEGGRLHPKTYVEESIIELHPENEIFGEINLLINGKNEFFGVNESEEETKPLKYFVRFNSRPVKFRYNFYFSKKENDFKNFFLIDDNTNVQHNDFSKRILENGKEVYSLILPDEILMKEKYQHKIFLKKEDEFNKSFSKYLAHPQPINIKFESILEEFMLEVFEKVD